MSVERKTLFLLQAYPATTHTSFDEGRWGVTIQKGTAKSPKNPPNGGWKFLSKKKYFGRDVPCHNLTFEAGDAYEEVSLRYNHCSAFHGLCVASTGERSQKAVCEVQTSKTMRKAWQKVFTIAIFQEMYPQTFHEGLRETPIEMCEICTFSSLHSASPQNQTLHTICYFSTVRKEKAWPLSSVHPSSAMRKARLFQTLS